MNKKTAIELFIIVAAFGAAAYVLYSHFAAPAVVPAVPVATEGNSVVIDKILPQGNDINGLFKVLQKRDFDYSFNYPQLSTSTELGVEPRDLVRPLPTTNSTK